MAAARRGLGRPPRPSGRGRNAAARTGRPATCAAAATGSRPPRQRVGSRLPSNSGAPTATARRRRLRRGPWRGTPTRTPSRTTGAARST
eukprot:5982560-Pyramimonas_sp.AAC.1